MSNYKMKTKKAVSKRVKRTGTGRLKRSHAYTSHMFSHKSQKQKRKLRKSAMVHPSDQKRIEQLLQN